MNVDNSEYSIKREVSISVQKSFEKARLSWEANKLGFLAVLSMLVIKLLSILLKEISFLVSENGDITISMEFAYIFVMIIAFFICPLIYCKVNKIKLNKVLPFEKVNASVLIFFLLIGLSVCTLSNYISNIIVQEFSFFGIRNNINFSQTNDSVAVTVIYIFSSALEPALAEEFLFRGVILSSLRKHGDGFAILISSILFGLMHGNISQIPFAFIVGIILSFSVVKTNSLLPSVLIHFFNNFLAVFYDYLQKYTDVFTSNIIYFSITILTVASALFAIFFLCKKNKADTLVKLTDKNNSVLTFKERIKCSILNPGIIIFTVYSIFETVSYLL